MRITMGESDGIMWKFLSEVQRKTMTAVLDTILPAGNGLPGAGQLGIGQYLDRVIGESPEMKNLFSAGLSSITMASEEKLGMGFCELGDEDKTNLLKEIEENDSIFFRNLILHAYNGYYTNPHVLKILGLGARAPQPQGYRLESDDLNSLQQVRNRGQIYRET
ncbi:gluconate 2-dehydrogenase subunit 3 family protein [SAR202 cluster bacterium AD-804-J14_MRT_500m]|nr:gluconate 2-dehydrogenase subunit 3 family protein [SAR202 cluster bacterium AD-804-J14_MRT_500m]